MVEVSDDDEPELEHKRVVVLDEPVQKASSSKKKITSSQQMHRREAFNPNWLKEFGWLTLENGSNYYYYYYYFAIFNIMINVGLFPHCSNSNMCNL